MLLYIKWLDLSISIFKYFFLSNAYLIYAFVQSAEMLIYLTILLYKLAHLRVTDVVMYRIVPLLRILVILGSNLGAESTCPDSFLCLSSVPLDTSQESGPTSE
jgi:hypothetical protein